MSTSTRDRIIKLLGEGIQQTIVAEAVGVSDSYISQLRSEEGVELEIAKLKAAKLEDLVEQNDTIDQIKKTALTQIKAKLPFVRSPLEAARVFQILDNSQRPTGTPAGDGTGAQILQIVLPKAAKAMVQIQLNAQNQVIDVEGRSMAPLPSKALPALAKARKEAIDAEAVPQLPQPQQQDKEVAGKKLEKLQDITTMMNGVALVL